MRRTSVALEFAVLVVILVGLAAGSSMLSFNAGGFKDIPLETAACFVTTLIIYHLWFYFRRNYHSENISKYIDYVYLSVAAVGLLVTGLEFSRQQYEHSISDAYEKAFRDLGMLPILLDDLVYACDQDKDPSKACKDMREIRTNFRFRLNEQKLKPTVDGVEGLVRWARAVQDEYVKLDNPRDSFLSPNAVDIRATIEGQRNGFSSFDGGGLLSRFRFVGFFLLATALALRITKVSIEIFEWHKKAAR